MEYFDFFKPGDLDNLSDDPQQAFIQFVEIADTRLTKRLEQLGDFDQSNWHLADRAQHGFVNVIIAAARNFEIEPFAIIEVPILSNYNNNEYLQFRSTLSHYITQIMLHAAKRDRSESIPILEAGRKSLYSYIAELREIIDSTQLPEWKRRRLHEAITKFEEELTRPRIRFGVAVHLFMTIAVATANIAENSDKIAQLATSIVRVLGEAKEADNERRNISAVPPAQLIPPRKPKPESPPHFERNEMDEEVPFYGYLIPSVIQLTGNSNFAL